MSPRPLACGLLAFVALGAALAAPVACAQPRASADAPVARPGADTLRTLSLARLVEDALARDPSLRAARLRAEATRARRPQAEAWPDPAVGVAVQPVPIVTARGAQRSQWQVEQPLPTPGARGLRGDVARLSAAIAARDADARALDVRLRVTDAYLALAEAQAARGEVEAFRARLRDFEEVVATRYEVGRGSQSALVRAQIERQRLGLRLAQLGADAEAARARLARLTRRPPDALAGRAALDAPALDAALTGVPGADAVAAALDARPEVAARRRAVERAEAGVALARKARWPGLTLRATYFDLAEGTVPPSSDGRDAVAVGVGVRVPLDRGRLRAAVEEAEAEARAAEADLAALQADLRAQVAALAAEAQSQRQQLRLLTETLLPQAEAALASTRSAYAAGDLGFLDLLGAERTRYTLRLDRLRARARLLRTRAALARATGA